ncbi:unnamed protein product [Ilex paraguariensis]|uniref:DUF629 domain-containing protein n=1 Tax=Ilex paraguariensis TaxID=185542 RepID=A0ABC8UFH3_9AQUA
MGPKNKRNRKNPHSHAKPRTTAKNATASGGEPPNTSSSDNLLQEQSNAEQLENGSINDECERSLAILHRGNPTEALKLIKDACDRYENSGLVHHTRASIHARVASEIGDRAAYQELMKNALESAKKAVSLSRDSIEFARTHAGLLFQLSSNVQDYEQVVKECERALSMYNLLPVKKRSEKDLKSIDKELNSILNKAKIGLMATGKNNVGTGENKSGFTEDPILTKIKKADKKGKLEEKKSNGDVEKIRLETRKIREFWNSFSAEKKREFVRPRINDVKVYCYEFKGVLGAEDLLSALGHGEEARSWKYWGCCVCEHRSPDGGSLIYHLWQKHLEPLSRRLTAILPQTIDGPTVRMLTNGTWKPVDTAEAVRIIENESKDPDDQNWPMSDDSERAHILERIHSMFQLLLQHKCIALSHFKMVMVLAENMLEKYSALSSSQLRTHGLHQNPICICFLGASQLVRILDFLQHLHSVADCFKEDEINVNQEFEAKVKVVLCVDKMCLSFDPSVRYGELTPSPYHNVSRLAVDGASETTFAVSDQDVDVLPDTDAFVKWLFEGCTIEEELASWQRLKDDKDKKGMEIYLILKEGCVPFENLCGRRYECLIQVEAIRATRTILAEERKRREQGANYMPQSFVSLLKRRQEELVESGSDSDSDRAELNVIGTILEDEGARATTVNEDREHLGDNCITKQLQELWEERSREVFNIDARILRSLNSIRRLNFQLAQVSGHDYQLIIVPLLKSFLQVQLQELFREALLEELESDTSKNLSKGCNQKHTRGKLKAKKKKKKIRKDEDSKVLILRSLATGGKPRHKLEEKDAEQADFSVPNDGHYAESQIAVSSSAAQLKQQEEELDRRAELEVEERMLAENLEHQRQNEDEAKRKQLAEKNKQADAGTTLQVGEALLSATGMPTDFPGVPVDKFEQITLSSPVSGDRPEWNISCLSHGKVNHGKQPFRKIMLTKTSYLHRTCMSGIHWHTTFFGMMDTLK